MFSQKRMPLLVARTLALLALVATLGCETLKFEPATLAVRESTPVPAVPLEEVWTYNAAAAFGPDAALVLGDVLFVTTRQGELHALGAERGKKRGLRSFGDAIEGAAAVDRQTVFLPLALGRYSVAAFDLIGGRLVWQVKGSPVVAGLAVGESFVIAADFDGKITAYAKRDGAVAWTFAFESPASVQVTPLVVGDRILVVTTDGRAAMLTEEDGGVVWSVDTGSPIYENPALAMIESTTLAILPTTRGKVLAINAEDGELVWEYGVDDSTLRFGAPAVSLSGGGAGEVVIGNTRGELISLGAEDGHALWRATSNDVFTARPLVIGDRIYAGTQKGALVVFNRTGLELERYEVKGRVKSAALDFAGGIVVLSEPRHVTYFAPAPHSNEYLGGSDAEVSAVN